MSTERIITFVIKTPLCRDMTFKQFKTEFADSLRNKNAEEIWKNLTSRADGDEIEIEADEGLIVTATGRNYVNPRDFVAEYVQEAVKDAVADWDEAKAEEAEERRRAEEEEAEERLEAAERDYQFKLIEATKTLVCPDGTELPLELVEESVRGCDCGQEECDGTAYGPEFYAEWKDLGVFYYPDDRKKSWVQGLPPTYPSASEPDIEIEFV